MGDDFGVGEAAHFAANRLKCLIEAGIANCALVRVLDLGCERRAVVRGVAGPDQCLDDRLVPERFDVGFIEAEVGKADDLALVHGNAAEYLGEIFAKPDPREQLLGLAESALLVHPAGVGRHFFDRLHVGGEPGEAVNGMLLGLDLRGVEPACYAHSLAHCGDGAIQEPLGGKLGLAGKVVERHGEFSMFGAVALHNALPLRLLQRVFLASSTGNRPRFG